MNVVSMQLQSYQLSLHGTLRQIGLIKQRHTDGNGRQMENVNHAINLPL